MNIWYNIPWSSDKDLGKAYNDFMRLIPNDDYACFIDRDAMFLTPFYGKQLIDIVNANKDCGIFVAKANRIGCQWQRETKMWDELDMGKHIQKATELFTTKYDECTEVSTPPIGGNYLGGFLMLVSKKVWEKVGGFKEGIGMLGVDNELHYAAQRHKEKILLMNGVYLYHWYRGGKAERKEHLL